MNQEQIDALFTQANSEAANGLAKIAEESSDKQIVKSAKKALYLLSTRGVVPDKIQSGPHGSAKRSQIEKGYLSLCDGDGNQLIWLVGNSADGGLHHLYSILLQDQAGVRKFTHIRQSLADIQKRIDDAQTESSSILFAPIETDYLLFRIEKAREINRGLRQPTPPTFLDYAAKFGAPAKEYPVHPVYSDFPLEEIEKDADIDSSPESLFKSPYFATWFLDAMQFSSLLAAWGAATHGIDAEAHPDRTSEEVLTEAIVNHCPSNFALLQRGRLVDTALVLAKSDHQSEAKQALKQAIGLNENTIATDNPYLRELVMRTLDAGVEMFVEALRSADAEVQPSEKTAAEEIAAT